MKKIHLVFPERIGVIAPELHGHFAEHIGGVMRDGLWVGKDSEIENIRGWRKETVELLRRIAPPVVRWPGGCYAETYHWRDGIGEDRPSRVGWWTAYDGRIETNEVGTHEFLDFCELIGTKPYIAVNVTSIPVSEAREWVEYCTAPRGSTTLALEREKNGHPEPFSIPYWGIGNENWGGGGHMTPEYYTLLYRQFSTILRNTARAGHEPGELIVGGANGGDYNWTQKLVDGLKNHGAVHGMSFHYYAFNRDGKYGTDVEFNEEQWYGMLKAGDRMEELIRRHSAITEGAGLEKKLPLVIDEWGSWYPDGSGPSKGGNLYEEYTTMRDAVLAANTMNLFHNYCDKIKMANVAQLCNNLHSLFLTAGEKCVTTPTYHVFDLFRHHQGGEAIRSIAEDNEEMERRVTVSASVKEDVMTVTLANCSCTEEAELSLALLGAEMGEIVEARVLKGDAMNAHNSFENPNAVIPQDLDVKDPASVKLPAASVAVIRVKVK